jgi:hypothetical protein
VSKEELSARAIAGAVIPSASNGDQDAYWQHPMRQEHQLNHLSRCQDDLASAA